jgi:hypothetical protein
MQEAEVGRIAVPGQPQQEKFSRPHLNGKKLGRGCMPVIPAIVGSGK